MTNVIPFPGRPAAARAFTQPKNGDEFLQRYPDKVRGILGYQAYGQTVEVNGTAWVIYPSLPREHVITYTDYIEEEIRTHTWIQDYWALREGRSTEAEFMAEIRTLVLSLLKELRTH